MSSVMVMGFRDPLSRADDEVLAELIGAPMVRLPNMLDTTLVRPTRLRNDYLVSSR